LRRDVSNAAGADPVDPARGFLTLLELVANLAVTLLLGQFSHATGLANALPGVAIYRMSHAIRPLHELPSPFA